MSIKVKWTFCVIISIIIILTINNLYLSFTLTELNLIPKNYPLIPAISIATIIVLFVVVYSLITMYANKLNYIRKSIGHIQQMKKFRVSKTSNDEVGKTMKALEELSITLNDKETEMQKQQRMLDRIENTDKLTGLPNRKQLLLIVQNNKWNERAENILLISIKLDRTLKIYALKGPDIFDGIIFEASKRIHSKLPLGAILGRFNTNHFMILLPLQNESFSALIKDYIQSLQRLLEESYSIEGNTFYIRCSIGISVKKQKEDLTLPQLIHLAELAVLEQKKEVAPNIFLFQSDLKREEENRYQLEVALRNAILNKDLCVVYQPIVSIDNQSLALEALVRWKYKDDWIRPDLFIPIVEELGLMYNLTLQVVEVVANDWKEWKILLPELSYISINISPSIIKEKNGQKLLNSLLQTVSTHSLPQNGICLEITENVLLEETTVDFMKQCRQKGFILAVDDFGTGYSSMTYLAKYSFDILKIDRAFIVQLELDKRQKNVAISIVQLAKRLNLRVVAEGVETKAQLRILNEMGVDAIQGYYFSRPQFLNNWDPHSLIKKRKTIDE